MRKYRKKIVISIIPIILITLLYIVFDKIYFITLFSGVDISWSPLSQNIIKGRVIDQTQVPYENIPIRYIDLSGGSTVRTDSQGYFKFNLSDVLIELSIEGHEVMINRLYRPLPFMSQGAEMIVIIERN